MSPRRRPAPRTSRGASLSLSKAFSKASFAALLVAVGLGCLVACDSAPPPAPPLLEIQVARVVQRDQPIEMVMVGETLGSADVPVRTRVEGELLGMHFLEGRDVEQDQLLYTIDPEPYEAKVVEAKGALAEAITHLAKAKADLDRVRPLAELNAVSQSDLDGAIAQYEAALGSRQSAQARVEQEEIQLGYTRIHSPISGRIGISEAQTGEFVGRSPNPVVLNFVSQTDPIRVRFSIDERTYLRLARRLRELERRTGEESNMSEGLELTLADGSVHPHPGFVVGADAAVDPKTGTFTFEADFANPEAFVLAGQFARIRAVAETREGALLVPRIAISELQGDFRIFVVGADGQVEMRSVELGPEIDRLRLVKSGIGPGELVALDFIKLRPGMTVKPRIVSVGDDGTIVEGTPGEAGSTAAARTGRPAG